MNNPWDIIKELESDNSRLKKEAIIRREHEADNVRFFTGVGACLDSFRTFGVQKVPLAIKDVAELQDGPHAWAKEVVAAHVTKGRQ